MRALEEAGIIAGYAALLTRKAWPRAHGASGCGARQARCQSTRPAQGRRANLEEVTWCHSLSGEMDYTMQVVMPDLKHYIIPDGSGADAAGVINVKSSFVLEKVKGDHRATHLHGAFNPTAATHSRSASATGATTLRVIACRSRHGECSSTVRSIEAQRHSAGAPTGRNRS